MERYWVALLCGLLLSGLAAAEPVERRQDPFGGDFGYYVYPIASEVPGIGSAAGIGASVINMAGGDTDFTGFYIQGDFEATGITLLDYHLIPRRLVFDVGYYNFSVAATSYDRGINSDPDDVIYPTAEGVYGLGQLTLTFDQRRYEFYVRGLTGRQRVLSVTDADGKAFEGVDTDWNRGHHILLGAALDFTDDRLDPRKGMRLEFSSRLPSNEDALISEYFVNDYNFTSYVPMRRWDTLAFNVFHSRAHISRKGITDYAQLQQRYGLNCGQYSAGPEFDACDRAESKYLGGVLDNNRYGTASSLGGTQRLRSFDNGRFYAGQALFYGAEYRWNLTDERTPFDIFIAKGVRTGIQLAAFWERGMVADNFSDLWQDHRTSYGIGARLILSGVIVRFDLVDGDEGFLTQLFITYPWSMFSVDDPS